MAQLFCFELLLAFQDTSDCQASQETALDASNDKQDSVEILTKNYHGRSFGTGASFHAAGLNTTVKHNHNFHLRHQMLRLWS